jgi:hypothetical protein
MRGLFTNETLTIRPGEAVSGIASRPQAFRVVEGDVWVTVEGFSHDYWLSAGETFTAQPGRLVVVESGHRACRITVPESIRSGWLQSLRQALAARFSTTRGWKPEPAMIKNQGACGENAA